MAVKVSCYRSKNMSFSCALYFCWIFHPIDLAVKWALRNEKLDLMLTTSLLYGPLTVEPGILQLRWEGWFEQFFYIVVICPFAIRTQGFPKMHAEDKNAHQGLKIKTVQQFCPIRATGTHIYKTVYYTIVKNVVWISKELQTMRIMRVQFKLRLCAAFNSLKCLCLKTLSKPGLSSPK